MACVVDWKEAWCGEGKRAPACQPFPYFAQEEHLLHTFIACLIAWRDGSVGQTKLTPADTPDSPTAIPLSDHEILTKPSPCLLSMFITGNAW